MLGGLIGYTAVLAALGVGVIYLLEIDQVSAGIEPAPRSIQAAVERPYPIDDEGPELRRGVLAR